jgi:hypothetical protein
MGKEKKLTPQQLVQLTRAGNNALVQFQALGKDMDGIATECVAKKGESLLGRVTACEKHLASWDSNLASLKTHLAAMKKLRAGIPSSGIDSPIATSMLVEIIARERMERTGPIVEEYRAKLKQWQEQLAKVKVK